MWQQQASEKYATGEFKLEKADEYGQRIDIHVAQHTAYRVGAGKEMMGSMRDGSGAECFLHFTDVGVAGKVLRGSPLPNVSECLNAMPEAFLQFKVEPAFSTDNASLCFWQVIKQPSWYSSPAGLQEYPLLGFFAGNIAAYKSLVENYYEKNIDVVVLEKVFESLDVTADQLMMLNLNIEFADLVDDFRETLGRTL